MKIIQCYIEQFGTLSQKRFMFDSSFEMIFAENGTGKTTLAVFIKAMLYGLPVTSKRLLDDNERKKYLPWQGGKYGGYLDFLFQDKTYRVERFFGAKEKDDTFQLYNLATNQETTDFSNRLGEELFHLDMEAYEKSTYLPQKDNIFGINNSISAKLTNLMENVNDVNRYDDALERLEIKRKEYSKKGNKGGIFETELALTDICKSIKQCQKAQEEYAEQHLLLIGEKDILQTEKKKLPILQEDIKKAQSQKEMSALREHCLSLEKEIRRLEIERVGLVQFFQHHIPTERELSSLEQKIEQYQLLQEEKDKINASAYWKVNYQTLEIYFHAYLAPMIDIDAAIQAQDQIQQIEQEMAMETVKKSALLEMEAANHQAKRIRFWIAIALSGLFTVIGIGMLFLILLPGIIVLSVGGLLGLFSVLFLLPLFKSKKPTEIQLEIEQSCQAMEELRLQKQSYTHQITELLAKYPHEDSEPWRALIQLKNKRQEYEAVLQMKAEYEIKLSEMDNKLKPQARDISIAFIVYGFSMSDINIALHLLRSKKEQFEKISQMIHEKKKELNDFILTKQVDMSMLPISYDLKTLEQQMVSCQQIIETSTKKITQRETKMAQLLEQIDLLSEYELQKETLEQQKALYEEKLEHILKTIELLKLAKNNLSLQYMTQMKRNFHKYMAHFAKHDADHFHIDADLQIMVERNGEKKVIDYFSEGYQDVMVLCARLALIDCLFTTEKPFIIFDDPFANLDDDKLIFAKQLLKAIACDYQMIYMTCHSSRTYQKDND